MSFNLATILGTAAAAPAAPAYRACGAPRLRRAGRGVRPVRGRACGGRRSPGQVVAIQLPNVPQFLTAYFGALKAGLTCCR